MKFMMPEAAGRGTITRATLVIAADCGNDETALLAHRLPAAWDPGTADGEWFEEQETAIDPRDARGASATDCERTEFRIDVTSWARAWAADPGSNHGLVLSSDREEWSDANASIAGARVELIYRERSLE